MPAAMAAMAERESRRNLRLRLACSRCQRRKIRCDMQFPTCSNCKKASAECVDGESLRLRDAPHNRVVSRLKRRVAWLESIVRERLPDVDLSGDCALDVSEAGDQVEPPVPMQDDQQDQSTPDARPSRQQTTASQPPGPPDQRAHEIGLVSVGVNLDQRYIGPSSGYFLARMLLGCSPGRNETQERNRRDDSTSIAQSVINELVEATQGPLPLPSKAHALQLCRAYFEVVHPQYPILHEPSFIQALDLMYNDNAQAIGSDPYISFQVFMVLAISSSILSYREKCHIPGESYCLSALQYLDRLSVENSLPGLQCILLLLVFTLHSPFMRLNVWYLNYQCIAALLDLGLQRNITTSSGISLLSQEMRTRIFWVVLTLDRTIATMMGRPIGLRDEACELRLPQALADHELIGPIDPNQNNNSSIAFSIHLFKLAKLNSEIKYVANSIVRDAPSYAYPPIGDNIYSWHQSMLDKLDDWAANVPHPGPEHAYIRSICMLRYHSVKMLLLRPSPAIPKPSTDALTLCFESAQKAIRQFDQLYRHNLLVHDWMTLHVILLSTITMLYCVRAVPDIANSIAPDMLMDDLSVSLSILSATGEHWSSAKRSRNVLDDLGRSTIRWVRGLKTPDTLANINPENMPVQERQESDGLFATTMSNADLLQTASNLIPDVGSGPSDRTATSDILPDSQFQDGFWFGLTDQFGDTSNVDDIMQNLFNDFIPQINNFSDGQGFYNP